MGKCKAAHGHPNPTPIAPDVIEAQLAHGKSGPLGSDCDRAEYRTTRKPLMLTWADYLDQLRIGAKVIDFKAA